MIPSDERVAEYQEAIRTCMMALAMLGQHAFAELLRCINLAESVGPLLHPTKWRSKHVAMEQDKQLLEGAHAFCGVLRKLQAEARRR